jgi:hypothetical protein
VTEVIAVEDLQTSRDSTNFTVTDLFQRERVGQPLRWTGTLPSRIARPLEMAGYDVRALLDTFGDALERTSTTTKLFGFGGGGDRNPSATATPVSAGSR